MSLGKYIQNIRMWNARIFKSINQIKFPLLIINGKDDEISNELEVTKLLSQYGGINKRVVLDGILHSIIDHPCEVLAGLLNQWACEQATSTDFELVPSVISVPRMVYSLRDYFFYLYASVYMIGVMFTLFTTKRSFLYSVFWLPCKLYRAIAN